MARHVSAQGKAVAKAEIAFGGVVEKQLALGGQAVFRVVEPRYYQEKRRFEQDLFKAMRPYGFLQTH